MQRAFARFLLGASKLRHAGSQGLTVAACRGLQTLAPQARQSAFSSAGSAATAALFGAGLSFGLAVAFPGVALAAGPNEELTFIAIKPDGVQRGLIAEIIGRFERKGYKMVAMKMLHPSKELAAKHYAEHEGKPFFPKLVDFLSSGPVVAMVWEGKDVIKYGRTMIGATNPLASAPGTIRGDLAVDTPRNIIHGSDGPESAQREIAHWFKAEELTEWKPITTPWVYE